jgi:hypothetical protein
LGQMTTLPGTASKRTPQAGRGRPSFRRNGRRLFVLEDWAPISLQERVLKMKLKVSCRTRALEENAPQMFYRLEQRIAL